MRAPRTTIAFASLLAVPAFVHAAPESAFVQLGVAEHAHAAWVGLGWNFGRAWRPGRAVVDGYLELALGRWHARNSSHGQDTVSQLSATPVLRYRPRAGSPWIFELGIGVAYTRPQYRNGDKIFSTRFNFADHLAVGYRFGEGGRHELALRLQHYSNGGLRDPNPGEDFLQLRYALRFPNVD